MIHPCPECDSMNLDTRTTNPQNQAVCGECGWAWYYPTPAGPEPVSQRVTLGDIVIAALATVGAMSLLYAVAWYVRVVLEPGGIVEHVTEDEAREINEAACGWSGLSCLTCVNWHGTRCTAEAEADVELWRDAPLEVEGELILVPYSSNDCPGWSGDIEGMKPKSTDG